MRPDRMRKKKQRHANPQAGFTLLEVLIAIFIFAVVAATIYGSFNAVASKNHAITRGMDVYESAQTALNRMTMDLKTLYIELPPMFKKPDYNAPPDPYRFVGEEQFVGTQSFPRLRFASASHLPMGDERQKGIAEIIYYVENRGEGGEPDYVLKRADHIYPYDQKEKERFEDSELDPVLCESVSEIKITYYDPAGEAQEQWDSQSDFIKYATPRAVEIELTLKQQSETYTFRTRVALPVYREEIK